MMTVKTVAKRLQMSMACVYAVIAAGEMRCYRIGTGRGAIRVSEEQLQEYLVSVETDSTYRPTPRKQDFVFLPPQS
jgi:excisionase family DNA binding protein